MLVVNAFSLGEPRDNAAATVATLEAASARQVAVCRVHRWLQKLGAPIRWQSSGLGRFGGMAGCVGYLK